MNATVSENMRATVLPIGPTGRIVLPEALCHTSALLKRQVEANPDAPYITIEGRTWTFGQTLARTERLAAGLSALGVREGTRVATMLPNVAAYVFAWLAAAHLGASIVSINPQFRGALADNALGSTDCQVLLLHASSADALASLSAPVRAQLMHIIGTDATSAALPGALALETLEAGDHAPAPGQRGDLASIHAISFTSGSTGPSKGVLITTNQALDSACTYIHAMRLVPDDLIYTPFGFFHGLSTRLALLPALIVGAQVFVDERFSASRYWLNAAACGATIGQTLPPMTAMLKALPASPQDRAHRITRMWNTRADEEFERRFGVHLVEAYGMTEVGIPVYTGFPERRAGSAGKVHPDWEMGVVDDHDRPVEPGAVGELVFRPRKPWLLTPGYVNNPQATLDTLRNLWFHSGDIGRQDADGFVFFIDRRKERIRSLGENVSSFDVESIVSGHPDVRECAALAHPAALGEDDVRIVVVRAEGSTLEAGQLYDWLTGVMPKYMLPRYIEFTAALPRTATNKIEKIRLKEGGLDPLGWDRELDVSRQIRRKASCAKAAS